MFKVLIVLRTFHRLYFLLPADATVEWAGLYWQGSIWNFKKGSVVNIYGNDSGDDGLEMMAKENRVIFNNTYTQNIMRL